MYCKTTLSGTENNGTNISNAPDNAGAGVPLYYFFISFLSDFDRENMSYASIIYSMYRAQIDELIDEG